MRSNFEFLLLKNVFNFTFIVLINNLSVQSNFPTVHLRHWSRDSDEKSDGSVTLLFFNQGFFSMIYFILLF